VSGIASETNLRKIGVMPNKTKEWNFISPRFSKFSTKNQTLSFSQNLLQLKIMNFSQFIDK